MEPLVDTHCHIHDSEYDFVIDDVLEGARSRGIQSMVCVGTDWRSSRQAFDFSQEQGNCYASLGLHPHLAVQPLPVLKEAFAKLSRLAADGRDSAKLVAIGECGLDYFYHRRPDIRRRQLELFRWQLKLARDLDLPLIFHVRQAFEDFWRIYKEFKLPAVVHSFSDDVRQVEKGLGYAELYFGLNGIMTFTKEEGQLAAARAIPSERLLLETDAPYLTPVPFRGKVNKPEYLRNICDFLAELRGEATQALARQTTLNARRLFQIRKP